MDKKSITSIKLDNSERNDLSVTSNCRWVFFLLLLLDALRENPEVSYFRKCYLKREYAFITKSTNNRKIRFQVSGKKKQFAAISDFCIKNCPIVF